MVIFMHSMCRKKGKKIFPETVLAFGRWIRDPLATVYSLTIGTIYIYGQV